MTTSKYREVYDRIRNGILSGEIEPGERIESERELARVHNIGVVTAARALSDLARDKFVVREVGRGTFAARPEDVLPREQEARKASKPTLLGVLILGRRQADPAYGGLIRELVSEATAHHCVVRCWELEDDTVIPSELRDDIASCDVLVVTGVVFENLVQELAWLGVPMVTMGPFSETVAADCMITRYDEAARLAVDHLVGLGHRRIGLVNGIPRKERGYADFREGYRSALAWHHLPFDEDLVCTCRVPVEPSYGRDAAEKLLALARPPTAVICMTDRLAYGVAHAVARAGLSIPGDLSLVGGEDLPTARTFIPPLTALNPGSRKKACAAVDVALQRLSGAKGDAQIKFFQPELIVRESTARIKAD